MPLDFDTSTPIYLQIIKHMKQKLATGIYQPGERIPSVRELALEFGVNPNTIQKALQEMEREGYLFSERTSGRFATKDENLMNRLRDEAPEKITQRYLSDMEAIGYKRKLTLEYLKKYISFNVDKKEE